MTPDNHSLYSISDLADQVGVPRTTITDWLGKYARFVELQTQGRRRFYTERTLSVLCKVAELRTAGRSTGDIDGELERIFPVHPTVEPPDAPSEPFPGAAPGSAGQAAPSPDEPGSAPQTYPVMKQENADELYDLFGSKFADLCDAMAAVNRKADASARRLRLMLAVAIMIIVVLACFLALFYAHFLLQRDNTAASRDAASAIAALTAGSETRENALRSDVGGLAGNVSGLAGNVSGLTGTVSGMNDEIQKLRADLPAQREAFEAALEEMRKSSGSALEAQQAKFEAQIAVQKEQFAAERLKLLQQIDSLQERLNHAVSDEPARAEELKKLRDDLAKQIELGKDVEKLRAELSAASVRAEELQKQNETLAGDLSAASVRAEELQKQNETLANDLAAANRRAADEAEARKKAEADAEAARRAATPQQNNYPYQPQNNGYPQFGFPGMQ